MSDTRPTRAAPAWSSADTPHGPERSAPPQPEEARHARAAPDASGEVILAVVVIEKRLSPEGATASQVHTKAKGEQQLLREPAVEDIRVRTALPRHAPAHPREGAREPG